ncbi:MAG: hypothetical protein V1721_02020 [Pseudomonadota bacterium]
MNPHPATARRFLRSPSRARQAPARKSQRTSAIRAPRTPYWYDTLDNVAKASLVAMMAGSDFIKTSTGKEAVSQRPPGGVLAT